MSSTEGIDFLIRRADARAKVVKEWASKFPDCPEDEVIFCFYSIVSLVDAYLIRKTSHKPVDHAHRYRLLRNRRCIELWDKGPMSKFVTKYRKLQNLSRDARYETYKLGEKNLQQARDLHNLLTSMLRPKFGKN